MTGAPLGGTATVSRAIGGRVTIPPTRRRDDLRLLRQAIVWCVRDLRRMREVPEHVLTGSSCGESLAVRVFGWPWEHQYLIDLLFDGPPCVRRGRNVPLGKAHRALTDTSSVAMSVCSANPLTARAVERAGGIVGLRWVDSTLSLPDGAEAALRLVTRTLRQDLRAAADAGYRVRTGTDLSGLDVFRATMYEPTMERRHPSDRTASSPQDLRDMAVGGCLVRVLRGDEWVAGGLAVPRGDELWFAKLGWLEGDAQLLRSHVVAMMFAEVIRQAESMGLARVNLGASRGFATDGVLAYKMKWRARPHVRRFQRAGRAIWGPVSDTYGVFVDDTHPGIRAFLGGHPVLARAPGGLRAYAYGRQTPSHLKHLSGVLAWLDLAEAARSVGA